MTTQTVMHIGEAVKLADCPPGLFLCDGVIAFKTEYGAMRGKIGPEVEWELTGYSDVYSMSGAYFHGSTTDIIQREALMVQPINFVSPAEIVLDEYSKGLITRKGVRVGLAAVGYTEEQIDNTVKGLRTPDGVDELLTDATVAACGILLETGERDMRRKSISALCDELLSKLKSAKEKLA